MPAFTEVICHLGGHLNQVALLLLTGWLALSRRGHHRHSARVHGQEHFRPLILHHPTHIPGFEFTKRLCTIRLELLVIVPVKVHVILVVALCVVTLFNQLATRHIQVWDNYD